MKVNQILQERRHIALKKMEQRIEEIRTKSPRFCEIEEEIKVQRFAQVNANLFGKDDKKIKRKMEALEIEKNKLLKDLGYEEDVLSPSYFCKKCKDTGILPDGKMCACKEQLLIEQAYQGSNLMHVLNRENFENFDLTIFREERLPGEEQSPRENMIELLEITKDFCENFKAGAGKNILFYGPVGTGKTYLLNCIAKRLLDRGNPVLYLRAYQLTESLQKYKFADVKTKMDIAEDYRRIFDSEILLIDDLGTEFQNNVSVAQIFELLNYRIQHRKTTLISTNLEPVELAQQYSKRIFSRIYGLYSIFYLSGEDLRFR